MTPGARVAAACVGLGLASCAHAAGKDAATETVAGAAKAAARVRWDMLPAEGLGLSPDEADVLLRTSVAREHPLGPRLEPFVLAWPGWGRTLRRFTSHPLADLDWIDVVGPREATQERLAARTTIDDAAVDARLAASSDGSLRVAARAQAHLVTVAPADGAEALAARLAGARVLDPPAAPDEGLRARLPHPHAFFKVLPEGAESGLLRVFSRPGGGAHAELALTCHDIAAANAVAASLREQSERANGVLVRMLTHDLLGGLSIELEGPTAKVILPASREQLEALATLAAGLVTPDAAP